MPWTKNEKKQFLEILSVVSDLYDKNISEPAIKLYLRLLEPYEFEAVKSAFERYLRNAGGNGSYFPKPADIIALIEGSPSDRASQAWAEVKEALERIGTYQSVRFRDPVINACINALGGWVRLGELDNQAIEFVGNEFRKLYRQFVRTGEIPEIEYLPGRVEIQNNARGFTEHIPVPLQAGTALPTKIALVDKAPIVPSLDANKLIQPKGVKEAPA